MEGERERRSSDSRGSRSEEGHPGGCGTSIVEGPSVQSQGGCSEEGRCLTQTPSLTQKQAPAQHGATETPRNLTDNQLGPLTDTLMSFTDSSRFLTTDTQRSSKDSAQTTLSTENPNPISPTDKQRSLSDMNRMPLTDSQGSIVTDTQNSPANDSHASFPADRQGSQTDRIPSESDQQRHETDSQKPLTDNWMILGDSRLGLTDDNDPISRADSRRSLAGRPELLTDAGQRQDFPRDGADVQQPPDGRQADREQRDDVDQEEPGSRKAVTPVSGWPEELEGRVILFGVPIVTLYVERQERLCLAQISSTLLHEFSYNEIHNRRVALGITCLQCTPSQLEVLRRAGAMPVTSRRCGLITKREAERLVRSFIADCPPPRLPDNVTFRVRHKCGWGNEGIFVPTRYNSSRAKCIRCLACGVYFSPNKFIFHCHPAPGSSGQEYRHPDAANFNSWRRHLELVKAGEKDDWLTHAWEDVKAMFNGGCRKRFSSLSSLAVASSSSSPLSLSSSSSASSSMSVSLPSSKALFPSSSSSPLSSNAMLASSLLLPSGVGGRSLSYDALSGGGGSGGGGGGGVYRPGNPALSRSTGTPPGSLTRQIPSTASNKNHRTNTGDSSNNNNNASTHSSLMVARNCQETHNRKHPNVNVPSLIPAAATTTAPHVTSFPLPGLLGPASAAMTGLLPPHPHQHQHHPHHPHHNKPGPPVSTNAHPAFFAASGLQGPVLSYGDYLRSMSRPYNVGLPPTSTTANTTTTTTTGLPVLPSTLHPPPRPPPPPHPAASANVGGLLQDLYRSQQQQQQQQVASFLPPGIMFGAAAAAAAAASPYPMSYLGYPPPSYYYAAAMMAPDPAGNGVNPAHFQNHHHHQNQHHHHLQQQQLLGFADGGRLATSEAEAEAAQRGSGGDGRRHRDRPGGGDRDAEWCPERKRSPQGDSVHAGKPAKDDDNDDDNEEEEGEGEDDDDEENGEVQEQREGGAETADVKGKTSLAEEGSRTEEGVTADETVVVTSVVTSEQNRSEDAQLERTATLTTNTTDPVTSRAEEDGLGDQVGEAGTRLARRAEDDVREAKSEERCDDKEGDDEDDDNKAKDDKHENTAVDGSGAEDAEIQEQRRKASLLPKDTETLLGIFEDLEDIGTFIHLPLETIRLLFKLSRKKSKAANKELRKMKELQRLQRQRAEEVREELSRQYFAIKESIWTKIQQEREMKAVLQERLAEIQKLTPHALDPSYSLFPNMK